MTSPTLLRLAAFTTDPTGGNPAGVWIGDRLPPADEMQRIAAEVGYSETAFLEPGPEPMRWTIRYYSPEAEIEFCGHATIASAVGLGQRDGDGSYRLDTLAGTVPVEVQTTGEHTTASFTSVAPQRRDLDPTLLAACLDTFGWQPADLDPSLVPDLGYAGAWHLILPLANHDTLAAMRYDFAALRELMEAEGITTLQVVWREHPHLFHARNPFPVGGVVEDPATGAAAAALGGYLREYRLVAPPADIVVRQGEDMGRPSTIELHVPTDGGIVITGAAVPIESPPG
jgi:PhzF family phenazine biosynthesis protein